MMQWTVRLEARTSAGEVNTTELVTFSRPGVASTLAEVGLVLAETKTLLARLQASMLCGQVAAYVAHHRVCAACGVLQPFKDRRTRRVQTLFGTVEVAARRFKLCRCRQPAPMAEAAAFSPVCALLAARCTPELERVQAELGARTSFRDGVRILESLLPALVRSATGGPVEAILDWFHLSMRVRHVEQVMGGLCALKPPSAPPDQAQIDVERLRHLLWNGHHEKACEALGRIVSWAKDAVVLAEPGIDEKVRRLVARCTKLRSFVETNEGALIDHGQRSRAGKPISTSRAEGTVNHLVNARMNKRRQMRCSPRGAHRVLQVRAAVLDGRFGHQAIQLAA